MHSFRRLIIALVGLVVLLALPFWVFEGSDDGSPLDERDLRTTVRLELLYSNVELRWPGIWTPDQIDQIILRGCVFQDNGLNPPETMLELIEEFGADPEAGDIAYIAREGTDIACNLYTPHWEGIFGT